MNRSLQRSKRNEPNAPGRSKEEDAFGKRAGIVNFHLFLCQYYISLKNVNTIYFLNTKSIFDFYAT